MGADIAVATAALTLLTVLVWSGLVNAASVLAAPSGPRSDERVERLLLALMIAPTLIGVAAAIAESFAPAVTFSFPDLSNLGAAGAAEPVRYAPAPQTPVDWTAWAAYLAVGVYAVGALGCVARLSVQTICLRRTAARAAPAGATLFDKDWGADVVITSEAVPPFASLSGRVVLPGALMETVSADQLAMIIAHERAHVRRRDTFAYLALSIVDALFWFSPFVRRQTSRCRLAAEIACDAAVTQGAPDRRDAYARTLLTVLKHAAAGATRSVPTVFSVRNKDEHGMRIRQIMAPKSARGGATVLGALAALMAPLALVQVAIAAAASNQTPEFTVAPIEGRLLDGFGERSHPITGRDEFTGGVIIAAAIGTPVFAPADGRVRLVMAHPDGYGEYLMIDHGGGYTTCYGPLTAIELAEGDRVAAGQLMARVGSSARDVPPYFFMEIQKDEMHVDPALLLNIPAAAS